MPYLVLQKEELIYIIAYVICYYKVKIVIQYNQKFLVSVFKVLLHCFTNVFTVFHSNFHIKAELLDEKIEMSPRLCQIKYFQYSLRENIAQHHQDITTLSFNYCR